MPIKLPSVLVISSVSPFKGPGVVGLNHYNSLKKGGCDVDFLTKYPVKGYPEFLSVYDTEPKQHRVSILNRGVEWLKRKISKNPLDHQEPGYYFFYQKETTPPVPVELILNKIKKNYDVVYILFWQKMLSFATIDAIYDKLKCQFHFRCVDYSPMTGGCHFTGNCERYKYGCGFCPGVNSKYEDDFTKWNVEYRKHVYEKVKPVVCGNSYMNLFFQQSQLLRNYNRCEVVYPLADNEKYRPLDFQLCRNKHQIPENKRFLIFFGSQNLSDERKGISYLLKSLRIFYDMLSEKERKDILLILAGHDVEAIKKHLCFDYIYFGYVNSDTLPELYSMSNVFLSPSINDAGPSMVNQAMSCGTPVVAFEMGTAIDVVKENGTGYCAKNFDVYDFAKGIKSIFDLTNNEYQALRHLCRDKALQQTSSESHVNNFIRLYYKYLQK